MKDLPVWDQLLQRYVDREGRVDYGGWQRHDRLTLRDWLADQGARTHGRRDHLAHWINLYNAFTIQAVLTAYPIASIRPTVMGLPNWFALLRFFRRRVHRLGSARVSLDWIENAMLRQHGDARIHFAIVCASLGCPQLRNRAYCPDAVDQQLEEDQSRFIRNPDKVRYDRSRNLLSCSKIFRWYRADFVQGNESLSSYLLRRLPTAAAARAEPRIHFLPYDWSLNQRTSS
jgi:hypothetical protein